MHNPLVIERLDSASAFAVRRAHSAGLPVYLVSTSGNFILSDEGRRLVAEAVVQPLGFERTGHYLYEAHAAALDRVDAVYEANYENNGTVRAIERLYGSPLVHVAFKKQLLEELSQFFTIHLTLEKISTRLNGRAFTYIPSPNDGVRLTDAGSTYETIRRRLGIASVPNATFFTISPGAGGRARVVLQSFAVSFWLITRFFSSSRGRGSWRIGMNVVAPEREFANDVQGPGLLIDGSSIKPDQVVALSNRPLSTAAKETLKRRGIAWLDGLRGKVSARPAMKAAPLAFRTAFESFFIEPFLARAAVELVLYHAKWTSFVRQYKLRHFVTYSDMDLQHVARNIILNQAGVQTWFYLNSANFPSFLASPSRPIEQMVHFRSCFLIYDHFVTWADEVTAFFERQRCQFKQIHNVGCLWTEHLMQTDAQLLPKTLLDIQSSARTQRKKIVAVFDSSYHEDSLTKFSDGLAFLKGILALMDATTDAFFVFKDKKGRVQQPLAKEFGAAYDLIKAHPRAIILPFSQNPSQLMAIADLVVSLPFTSTTFEALSARKKAIYFDPTDKFRGSYYARFPNVLCHGAVELIQTVSALLDLSADDWQRSVAGSVIGTLEPFGDGKALSRFREKLAL